jgi:hypothetical protein
VRKQARERRSRIESQKAIVSKEKTRLLFQKREVEKVKVPRTPPRRLGVSKKERERFVSQVQERKKQKREAVERIDQRLSELNEAEQQLSRQESELTTSEAKLVRKIEQEDELIRSRRDITVVKDEEGQTIARFEEGEEEGVLIDPETKEEVGTTTREEFRRDRSGAIGTGISGGLLFPDPTGFGGAREFEGTTTLRTGETLFEPVDRQPVPQEPTRRETFGELARRRGKQTKEAFLQEGLPSAVRTGVASGFVIAGAGVTEFGLRPIAQPGSIGERLIVSGERIRVSEPTTQFLALSFATPSLIFRTGGQFASQQARFSKETLRSGVFTQEVGRKGPTVFTESFVTTKRVGRFGGSKEFVTKIRSGTNIKTGRVTSLDIGETRRLKSITKLDGETIITVGRRIRPSVTVSEGFAKTTGDVTTQFELSRTTVGRNVFQFRRGIAKGIRTERGTFTFGRTEPFIITPRGERLISPRSRGEFVGFIPGTRQPPKIVGTGQRTPRLISRGTRTEQILKTEQLRAVNIAQSQITRPPSRAVTIRPVSVQAVTQRQRIIQRQTPIASQFTGQRFRSRLANRQIIRTQQVVRPSTRNLLIPRVTQAIIPRQAVRSRILLTSRIGRPTKTPPRVVPPGRPPITPPSVPSFDLPSLRLGGLSSFNIGARQRFRSVPSFRAILFRQFGGLGRRDISGLRFAGLRGRGAII